MTMKSDGGFVSASPEYLEHSIYNIRAGTARVWEFSGWRRESLSWKNSCYIHAGLSGRGSQIIFRGPEAKRFLASICVNGFENFSVGAAKHAIMCIDNGLIASHGVLQRLADDTFRLFCAALWAPYQYSKTGFDVEQVIEDRYLFQIAGPNSLPLLEKLSGENLSDIRFLRSRDIRIAGMDMQIMRVGMAGTLAYELHGPMSEAHAVYQIVFEAGEEFGIERLGWRTYGVNHIEGGFPQQTWTFLGASDADPGYQPFMNSLRGAAGISASISGSVDHSDMRARWRSITEVGWEKSVNLDHDFIGREAVAAELAAPKRTIVTLEWNAEDVTDVFASQVREDGEPYSAFEMPVTPAFKHMVGHADHVTIGGRRVGVSSSVAYSYYYRKFISHCTIDRDAAEPGTDVIVHWGEAGRRIKEIRARTARFPYLNISRNADLDLKRSA